MTKACVFTIPAGLSFVDVLAKGILDEAGDDPLSLARIQVLLPTRRACRSLREAFLKLSEGKPLLLPRMNPIGDVEEDDLSLTLAGLEEELSLPPAIPPLRRQFLLARLIASMDQGRGIQQDMALAAALGRLMDQVYTEDLDLKDLPLIVDREDFSAHWQISLDFLSILSEHWPLILESEGLIDSADRRNRLIKTLNAHWESNPPQHKIIAAGSTGSIPATALLLKTIANLPNGCIVLPGLDQRMDDDSWLSMDDTHPQATLRHLLETLHTTRSDVAIWPYDQSDDTGHETVRAFASEVMRPSETSQAWQTLQDRLPLTENDLNIERYDCTAPQEEALTIALTLRGVLEDPTKTAALVTPDRRLAKRVAMACNRWGIQIDDSGGQGLADTTVGTYLRLCMEALCADIKPVALLDFCKHTLCLPPSTNDWRSQIRALDLNLMRGPAFAGGMKAYDDKLKTLKENAAPFKATLDIIGKAFAPLLAISHSAPFETWCNAHLKVCENFCDPSILWAGQDGESAAAFFTTLQEQSGLLPPLTGKEYLAVLEQAMVAITVRPAYGLHPRLMVLGQLEARLVEADVMILSGLNEGTWPPAPTIDPWMSRPMRKRFGLPPLERSIGLSAHDFAQSLCAQKVILTRSLRVDGTPTVPSRWLQRMDAVLQACGLPADILQQGDALQIARQMDHVDRYAPVERPAPTPPVSARPRKLSVTQIDSWINDPYSIYAKEILKLKPLKPLEQDLDAAMRGTLIHDVLDQFVAAHKGELPANAKDIFMTIARKELDALSLDADIRAFWEPRLLKIAAWVVDAENTWREDMRPASLETKGTMIFNGPAGDFTLSARADRIDQSRDGKTGALIDYKSGGTYSKTGMKNGQYPQLPLEALILEQGGFENTKMLETSHLAYWVVNGAKEGGTTQVMDKPDDLTIAKDNACQGLIDLITLFDNESTPYFSLPRPEKAPRFQDYEHLARVREWTALDEQEDAA